MSYHVYHIFRSWCACIVYHSSKTPQRFLKTWVWVWSFSPHICKFWYATKLLGPLKYAHNCVNLRQKLPKIGYSLSKTYTGLNKVRHRWWWWWWLVWAMNIQTLVKFELNGKCIHERKGGYEVVKIFTWTVSNSSWAVNSIYLFFELSARYYHCPLEEIFF